MKENSERELTIEDLQTQLSTLIDEKYSIMQREHYSEDLDTITKEIEYLRNKIKRIENNRK